MNTTSSIFSEIKKTLNLAAPLLFSEWLYALNFFVSTWIAAQLGREALAAIALVQSIYFFLLMMISGISAAIAILVAHDLGANDLRGIKHIFVQGLLLNLILVVIAGLILWNVPYILAYLKIANSLVILLTQEALHAYLYSLIPLAFLIMLEKFLIGLHRTRLVLFFTIWIIPVSIIANYTLVLGKWGLPYCGLAGFGYGHAIAYGIFGVLFIGMTFMMPSLRVYQIFSAFKNLASNFKYFFEIWRVGWPLGAMFSIEMGAVLLFTFFMSLFGTEVLAAFQVTRPYLVFALTSLFALVESAAVTVGYAVGENNRQLVKRRFYINVSLTTIFMMMLASFYLSAQKVLIAVDINMADPANHTLITHAHHFLVAIAVFIIFDGIRNTTAGSLRGLKDTRSNMYSSILGYWICGLPLAYLLGRILLLGGDGLWAGFIAGIAISAFYLWMRFRYLSSRVDLELLRKY